ncbi:MAG: MotA/TolQ/ExbB proton channel family protein [Aeromonadaceae bacterium]
MSIAHLLNQSSGLALLPPILLLMMSIGTGYYLLFKSWSRWQEKRQSKQFLHGFWHSRHLQEIEQRLQQTPPQEAYARLAAAALDAANQLARRNTDEGLLLLGSADEFVLRALRQAITRERLRLEAGLTFLASVGSAAPFVGLFGTVWGIYHALLVIGASGQSTLDKVAAPVGEALIMTGFGLAVALPAVLIYNLYVRLNRLQLVALEEFAHDLFALLTTGSGVLAAGRTMATATPSALEVA